MGSRFTLFHALHKTNKNKLYEISEKFGAESKLNPNAGKTELVKELIPFIPDSEGERIIDETFNTPKTKYTGHIGNINENMPDEINLKKGCLLFNRKSDYNQEIPEYQTNQKEEIELVLLKDKEATFYYTLFIKAPQYDYDSMESKVVVTSKKIRIIVNVNKKIVTVFTGDKDLFNNALSALTIVMGFPLTPLEPNLTGISEVVRGSFSFHTVKVLDYVFHGLSMLGTIGAINEINLETSNRNKNVQKVKVQGGTNLIDDKSICEYLFIYSRDLIGLKLDLKLNTHNLDEVINLDIGIRSARVKIGIKKGKNSIEKLQFIYEILENNIYRYIKEHGLINEEKTIQLLEDIRKKALE
ncbi:hypothetical protein QPL77_12920 [Bacillus pumilus]|uniref:hypothetical protein n=1 Tax=Bacillus TaxID=1386 RepID=UPI00253FF194|nr:hypothetical protein [Bacillus pumilus]WIG30903.1 hypothetical protein QPL77_12920 [Bacillus pumilus]